jgi:DNA-directed RNA polymerase subunit K
MEKQNFTKYEVARILGARALQISMDAPLLINIEKEELEKIRYDPLLISEKEFNSGVLPITVKRPLPEKKESKLKREEVKKEEDREIEEKEKQEEKEIQETGEIMEMAKPEDESEESEQKSEEQ